MASISNVSLIQQSRFSSLYKQHNRSSAAPILHKSGHITSRANHLEFLPLSKKIALSKPVKFAGRTPGLNEILNLRGSSEFCITKAAAADAEGHEIELSNGFEQFGLLQILKFLGLIIFLFTCSDLFLQVC